MKINEEMYILPCCSRPCPELMTVPKHYSASCECSFILPAECHKKRPDIPHVKRALGYCSFNCLDAGLIRLSVHFKSRKALQLLCRGSYSESFIWRRGISLVRAIGRGWDSARGTNGNLGWEGRMSAAITRSIWCYKMIHFDDLSDLVQMIRFFSSLNRPEWFLQGFFFL